MPSGSSLWAPLSVLAAGFVAYRAYSDANVHPSDPPSSGKFQPSHESVLLITLTDKSAPTNEPAEKPNSGERSLQSQRFECDGCGWPLSESPAFRCPGCTESYCTQSC